MEECSVKICFPFSEWEKCVIIKRALLFTITKLFGKERNEENDKIKRCVKMVFQMAFTSDVAFGLYEFVYLYDRP